MIRVVQYRENSTGRRRVSPDLSTPIQTQSFSNGFSSIFPRTSLTRSTWISPQFDTVNDQVPASVFLITIISILSRLSSLCISLNILSDADITDISHFEFSINDVIQLVNMIILKITHHLLACIIHTIGGVQTLQSNPERVKLQEIRAS